MIIINYVKKLEELGFPVGSRVVMAEKDPTGYVKKGEVGIVCHYTKDWEAVDGCNIGVEFEMSDNGRHNCMGHCKNRYGRYVPHTGLSRLDMDLGSFDMSDQDFDFLLGINT